MLFEEISTPREEINLQHLALRHAQRCLALLPFHLVPQRSLDPAEREIEGVEGKSKKGLDLIRHINAYLRGDPRARKRENWIDCSPLYSILMLQALVLASWKLQPVE